MQALLKILSRNGAGLMTKSAEDVLMYFIGCISTSVKQWRNEAGQRGRVAPGGTSEGAALSEKNGQIYVKKGKIFFKNGQKS